MFFLVGNSLFLFMLTISEAELLSSGSFTFFDLVFEQVSAMGTVDLALVLLQCYLLLEKSLFPSLCSLVESEL